MVQAQRKAICQCMGKSVQGASHRRKGLVNQDAILWYPNHPEIGKGMPIVLAVSDGHGSSTNFRSDRGSQFAVKTAVDVLSRSLLHTASDYAANYQGLRQFVDNRLCRLIHQEWLERVQLDWRTNPVSLEDPIWQKLSQEGNHIQTKILHNPEIAYGATLLVVFVVESFILYLQLGDGDILCVDIDGHVTRPIQSDPRLIANQTTSLCLPNAWQEFQVVLKPYQNRSMLPPALILVSSDGYANSFPSEQDFLQIGRDYLQMLQTQSIEALEEHLSQFLNETSLEGSGDDITLGILQHLEYFESAREPIKTDPPHNTSPITTMTLHTTQLEVTSLAIEDGLERLETQHRRLSQQIKQLRLLVLMLLLLTLVSTLAGAWFAINLNRWLHNESLPRSDKEGVELPAQPSSQPTAQPSSQPTAQPTSGTETPSPESGESGPPLSPSSPSSNESSSTPAQSQQSPSSVDQQ